MAYFVISVDSVSGATDGLGRTLSKPPVWARFFFETGNSWAGLGWHLLDCIWFFGGLAIAFKLYGYSVDGSLRSSE